MGAPPPDRVGGGFCGRPRLGVNRLALGVAMTKRQSRLPPALIRVIRASVFDRDRHMCRCCGVRAAQTLHNIVPRSRGGVVSTDNSIACCGTGTTGCRGFLQRHEIIVDRPTAQDQVVFMATTKAAATHVDVRIGDCWRSPSSILQQIWLVEA